MTKVKLGFKRLIVPCRTLKLYAVGLDKSMRTIVDQ